MFIVSMFFFSVFSLGAGFSQNGMTLDVLCGVLGIFSAAAVPPAQGMLGVIYARPSQRKNRAFGCFGAGNPMGFIFGTILAGVFTQVFNWRAGFFLLAIVYFCISIIAAFTVPEDTTPKQKFNAETMKKLDLPGTALTIFGIGMFCAALRYGWTSRSVRLQANTLHSLSGNAPQGWKTPYVLVLLILGAILIISFVVWELNYPYAMIDMKIWRDRDFSLVRRSMLLWGFCVEIQLRSFTTLLATACHDLGTNDMQQLMSILALATLGFPVLSFWIALYFQRVQEYSALMTGVHMLPMAIVGLTANAVAALIQHKVSNKLLVGIGSTALTLSFTLAALQRDGDSYWAFAFPALCLCVVGIDFNFIVANVSFVTRILQLPHLQCHSTSNPLPVRSSRRYPVYATLLLLESRRQFSMLYRKVQQNQVTTPATLPSPTLSPFGSRLQPRFLACYFSPF